MTRTILFTAVAALALAGCGGRKDEAESAGSAAPTALPSPTPTATPVAATGNPEIAGTAVPTDRSIADTIAATPSLSTLAQAIRAADLTPRLAAPGSITVFAPSNAAFGRLAPGTVDSLLKPENKASLVKLLSYHVVAGSITADQLVAMIRAAGGTATLTSILGQPIRATMTGNVVTLTSATGNLSYVEIADIRQTNGVIHVVNGVLVPTLAN
ncbi:putative surface protein with fasciclin (FAS1) repeats [Sphingomonas jinjuensis]|uniref:Putative surface protein with fasciclin (FAS1) repeats n=1 Tax=Sphingomonas jinjuensis TaxID=535907 RepID=A0A840F0K1_9SPHN|nr:fasciclin domain-containing protein [Sphingomonas jinjuensis]MBB4152813.1 putative surface protein with fasciclin (FAS1) repeats [Sphingomonas jinjuensis]